ncbi:hypothetical protein VTN00DRAFT_6704 [Thermoascus crustaceus]|uniref:uncharacterized protein n=1 Tax=Thermoascus crustaceus TaxID=5088 RepID=UPI00374495D7
MAPLHRRQMHFIPPPRPPKGPPGTPVPVTKLISIKVFLLLFLGTACIFIVGVFFWRIGAVIRFFTQDRVLGGGRKPTTARYAKTWYGWVPLARHEANKQIFKKCFRKIRRWMEWKSSRADYNWVWWDPGQNGRERYYGIRRVVLRWVPKWLMSYDAPTANSIWNPGPPTVYTETANDHRENRDPRDKDIQVDSERRTPISGSRNTPYPGINVDGSPAIMEPLAIIQPSLVDKPQCAWERYISMTPIIYPIPNLILAGLLPILCSRRISVPLDLKHLGYVSQISKSALVSADGEPTLRRTVSLPSVLDPVQNPGKAQRQFDRPSGSDHSVIDESHRVFSISRESRLSRKYRAWAARMQIQTFEGPKSRSFGYSGRPGSPISELLKSFSSEQSAYSSDLRGSSLQSGSIEEDPLEQGHGATMGCKTNGIFQQSSQTNTGFHSSRRSILRSSSDSQPLVSPSPRLLSPNVSRVRPLAAREPNRSAQRDGSRKQRRVKFQAPEHTKAHRSARRPIPFRQLSDPEVRLMYDLNRKLEWLQNELDPGRKPFHFATLMNHWLNTETWVVYDPPSRVSTDVKRRYGDPRFNVPFPDRNGEARKPKYPVISRKRAQTPRIDSWRIAVNKERKSAGLQDFLKAIELFDGSADEPPDGKIDPASWILRRPPQGFEMSTKQKNAYYEGGAGWQETLSDWQKVRRGYRIRKGIYEGRVNRTRVKEIASGVNKGYRAIARKMSPALDSHQKRPVREMEKQRRRERSGNGTIRRTDGSHRTSLTDKGKTDNIRQANLPMAASQNSAGCAESPDIPHPTAAQEDRAADRSREQAVVQEAR